MPVLLGGEAACCYFINKDNDNNNNNMHANDKLSASLHLFYHSRCGLLLNAASCDIEDRAALCSFFMRLLLQDCLMIMVSNLLPIRLYPNDNNSTLAQQHPTS